MGVNKFYPEQMNIQQFIHPLGPAGGSTPMNIAPWSLLTHWGRDKMAAIFQTTLSNAFSWMKIL